MIMLVISVTVSAFVACFVMRKIWLIYKRGKIIQKRARDQELLQQAQRRKNSTSIITNARGKAVNQARNGMTEGQCYKFAFLIGLFLTNLLRCGILIYDGLQHTIFEKSEH